MKAVPKTSLLYAFRAERPSYPLLCGEAIDNALDAAASWSVSTSRMTILSSSTTVSA